MPTKYKDPLLVEPHRGANLPWTGIAEAVPDLSWALRGVEMQA
jgi:hypothetical protein